MPARSRWLTLIAMASTAVAAANAAELVVGDAAGRPGDVVTFDVRLNAQGDAVAGTQNDISFGVATPIARKPNGKADCRVVDFDQAYYPNGCYEPPGSGGKGPAVSFAFRPVGCGTSDDCDSVRALILSTDSVGAIADGSVLYTCTVAVAADAAPGRYPLMCRDPLLSNPCGQAVRDPACRSGVITVLPCPGDCNGDVQVTIDELVSGLRVAQEIRPVDTCEAADVNGDGAVTVDELVAALNRALDGCGP